VRKNSARCFSDVLPASPADAHTGRPRRLRFSITRTPKPLVARMIVPTGSFARSVIDTARIGTSVRVAISEVGRR
jgi:hypothetical protein